MLATFVLLLWIPACLLFYTLRPPAKWHRAMIGTYLVGFFFLPHVSIAIPFVPDFDRSSAILYAMLLGTLFFDTGRILGFRPRWFDVPMLFFCMAPGFSSITNDLGVWDAISEFARACIAWGLPYLMGRMYLTTPDAFRDLVVGFIMFALIYVPLALWEMRMSPQLHLQLYGFTPPRTTMRGAFFPFQFKPVVFMSKPFFVAMTFGVAAVFSTALVWGRLRRSIFLVPLLVVIPGLIVVTIMAKVWSSTILMMMGLGVLAWTRATRTRIALLACILIVPLYIGTRVTGKWSGDFIVELVRPLSEAKAGSFEVRIENEDALAANAMERPAFGWGAWNRGREFSDWDGRNLSRTDGLWIIVLLQNGLFGLLSFLVAMLLPVWLFARAVPPGRWLAGSMAPVFAVAIAVTMHMIDNIPNAFANPVFYIGVGGLASMAHAAKSAKGRRRLDLARAPNARAGAAASRAS